MDKTNISPFYNLPTKIALPSSLKSITVVLRSKDIAPVLYNLADTSVHGAVHISGNEQAIVIEYKTDMGAYQIAIPLAAEYMRKKADKSLSLFKQGA